MTVTRAELLELEGYGIALPMRCQPPHYGHLYLIGRFARISRRVVVFLSRDYGTHDDPFTFTDRRRWLVGSLSPDIATLVDVPVRSLIIDRVTEYSSHFGTQPFVVVTTSETDAAYKALGFNTLNHMALGEAIHGHNQPTSGFGREIRRRLRNAEPCDDLLPEHIEIEARRIILDALGEPD